MFLLKGAESISELYERTGCFLSEIADREDLKDSHIFDFNPWSGHDSFVEPDKRKYADKKIFWKYKVPKKLCCFRSGNKKERIS